MIVIISNHESEPNDFGQRKSSVVYHYKDSYSQCGTAKSIKEPVEVEEDLAKAFGRTLCGSCKLTHHRFVELTKIKDIIYDQFGQTLDELIDALPLHLELRIYAHNLNKTPVKVWSSYDEVN